MLASVENLWASYTVNIYMLTFQIHINKIKFNIQIREKMISVIVLIYFYKL